MMLNNDTELLASRRYPILHRSWYVFLASLWERATDCCEVRTSKSPRLSLCVNPYVVKEVARGSMTTTTNA